MVQFKLLRVFRDESMRLLAERLGFQYTGRSLPAAFPAAIEPFDKITLKWNVLCGQQNGIELVVFDGIFGGARGVYRTYIAAHTANDPFTNGKSVPDKVLVSGGWFALFGWQKAFNVVPWSLSVDRIEEYVKRVAP
jgi:hypothetical protein